MVRLGQHSRWLALVLDNGSGAWPVRCLGMPGRLAHYAQLAVRPQPRGREDRMAGFLFRLETVEGEPAEPPTLSAAVPNWKPGDTIALGKRMLRVVALRDVDGDAPPVLVVEDIAGLDGFGGSIG